MVNFIKTIEFIINKTWVTYVTMGILINSKLQKLLILSIRIFLSANLLSINILK